MPLIHKGISLTPWRSAFDTAQFAHTLDLAQAAGVTHIALNTWWFQDDTDSVVITPDLTRHTASDEALGAMIAAMHERGLAVMLKPMVDLRRRGLWRGQITGGPDWFANPLGYRAFINHFAELAQAQRTASFCVGCELMGTDLQAADWRATIAGVRERYTGPLVYAAQHGTPATARAIDWWDALEFIGIDAYYPLASAAGAGLAELTAAWEARAKQLDAWWYGLPPEARKPVLLTEAGYRSWRGAAMHPWDFAHGGSQDVDLAEQAACYEALLTVLTPRAWFEGIYWWNWEVHSAVPPDGQADNGFGVVGKPAYDVMARHYRQATPA